MTFTSTQNYIDLLEKTNQQLSLWYNPYALMVGILTLLVALLAMYFAYILWRQSRDYKDFLEEQRNFVRDDTRKHAKEVLDEAITRQDAELQHATGEVRERIEGALNSLKTARESLNVVPVQGIRSASLPLSYVVRPARNSLTEAQTQSIIALLQSFGADTQTIREVETALRN